MYQIEPKIKTNKIDVHLKTNFANRHDLQKNLVYFWHLLQGALFQRCISNADKSQKECLFDKTHSLDSIDLI